jgi:hypothetical protein
MNRALMAVLAAAMMLAPAGAWAATPSAGVAQEIRSGFFVDLEPGAFFSAGGTNSRGNKGVSNAQLYFQLGVGYDIIKAVAPSDAFGLALGLNLGVGASAGSCFATVTTNGACLYDPAKRANDPDNIAPDNFTWTLVGLEVIFKVKLVERLYLRPRVLVGYAFLDPQPIQNLGMTFYAGIAAGIEYMTPMDHFSIGLDVDGKLIIGPNIPAFAIYPMFKYTF